MGVVSTERGDAEMDSHCVNGSGPGHSPKDCPGTGVTTVAKAGITALVVSRWRVRGVGGRLGQGPGHQVHDPRGAGG